jgi:ectoine hydroxylase-related dioxygenase (phytanoyl-CoA dioxygenase family)
MATVTSALGPAPGAAWHTDGYVVRRGAVDRATCEAVLARAGDASRLYHDPDVAVLGAAWAADLLHAPVQVTSSHLVLALPGAAGTPWSAAAGTDRPREGAVILHLALTDATLASGCPWAVPGSHTRAEPPGLPVDGAVPLPLAVGDAVLLDGGLGHRVTDNHSVDATAALVVVFHRAAG